MPSLAEIGNLIASLGVVKGTFVVFFFVAHGVILELYNGRVQDRQNQIDRLADENKEYRERFTVLLDKKLNVPKSRLNLPSKPSKKRKRG
jgi:hypothetical protein